MNDWHMLHDLTLLLNGMTAGVFGLAAALFLFVFKRSRLRVVLGVIMAVYTLYFLKDIFYMYDPVVSDKYLYRILLSIDNWLVPLYAVYAFEVVRPGRTTLPWAMFLLLPFPLFTILYACRPLDSIFNALVAFSSVFSAVCMCVVLYMTCQYRRRLKDNRSDISHMDVRWLWGSIAIFLPNLVLWTLLSTRLDFMLDAVYYLTISFSWGIVAYHTYYYVPLSGKELMPEPSAAACTSHFYRKLESLAAEGFFVHSPRLTLTELAAELGTNRTTLSNYLNQELGTTFYDYINSQRISRAEELLADPSGRHSVEQLAELSGFNSLSTFRRAFYKKHGMSPQRYREKVLGVH